jgi:phytoene dehydrogenase-like protein
MMDLLRVLPIPVKGYLDSWFVSDAVKGAVGAGGITGLHQGPRAAGTTLMLLYQHACGFPGGRFVLGGIGQLSQALADAARTNGAEIRTEAPVVQILVEDSKVTGVALAEGTAIKATVVMSSTTPETTFFRLVGPQRLPPSFMRQARNIIYRGSTAKVNLALSGLPQFRGQTSVEQLSGRIRISPSLDYLERAYDEAKYGRMSRRPYLEAVIPTLVDPLLAPPGHHILSITMRYAPSRLRDGSWEAERESLGDLVVDTLAEYAPGLETLIQQRQVITPWDWQQQYGLTEGGIHHGQMGLDQLLVMRPVPGWGRYRTPLANLYLCGSGAHPGGGVTGAPGYNAARTVEAALRGG